VVTEATKKTLQSFMAWTTSAS